MYNEEVKKLFLDTMYENEKSKEVVQYIFKHSALTEEVLNKDLYMFTLDEIKSTVRSMRYTSTNTVRNTLYIIKNYIDWSYEYKFRSSNVNVLTTIDSSIYHDLVRKKHKTLMSREEFESFKSKIPLVDSVIFDLLWNGIMGRELHEIRTLEVSNINNGQVTVFEKDNTERTVHISEELIAKLYLVNDTSSVERFGKTVSLMDSPYIFKKSSNKNGRSNEEVSMPYHTMLKIIKNTVNETEYDKMTAKGFFNSGMLEDYYLKLKEINGDKFDLSNPDMIQDLSTQEIVDLLAKKYNWKKYTDYRGYENYGVQNYTRNFLNIETVVEIYG